MEFFDLIGDRYFHWLEYLVLQKWVHGVSIFIENFHDLADGAVEKFLSGSVAEHYPLLLLFFHNQEPLVHAIEQAHILLIRYVHTSMKPSNILQHDCKRHANDKKCNGQARFRNDRPETHRCVENYRNYQKHLERLAYQADDYMAALVREKRGKHKVVNHDNVEICVVIVWRGYGRQKSQVKKLHVKYQIDQTSFFVDGDVQDAGKDTHDHGDILNCIAKFVDQTLIEIKQDALHLRRGPLLILMDLLVLTRCARLYIR